MRISTSATQKDLPLSFLGRGEVRNFLFRQIAKSAAGYLYEVTMPGDLIHFEVFRRTENLRFSCISYPSSKKFGVIGWTCKSLNDAILKFNSLVAKEEGKGGAHD